MATPTTDGATRDEHETAVRVSNELLRQLCAGELGALDIAARAADLAAHPEVRPDASGAPAEPATTGQRGPGD